jgi:hypothetical protein
VQRIQPRDGQTAREFDTLIWYWQRQHERLDYRFARQEGYPLESGGIKSANQCMCHRWLKRSGAWWYVANANQMLALRGAKDQGTLDRVLARYRPRIQPQSG